MLVPINMAQLLRDALSVLEDAVGDIDDYAAIELSYAEVGKLHDALINVAQKVIYGM